MAKQRKRVCTAGLHADAVRCIAPNSLDTRQCYAAVARRAASKSARTSSGDLSPFFCSLQ